MRVVVYQSADPLSETERFLAFLSEEVALTENGKKTGMTAMRLLPVRFAGETALAAENRAMAFWNDEIAKALAKAERGRALGLSRRKGA